MPDAKEPPDPPRPPQNPWGQPGGSVSSRPSDKPARPAPEPRLRWGASQPRPGQAAPALAVMARRLRDFASGGGTGGRPPVWSGRGPWLRGARGVALLGLLFGLLWLASGLYRVQPDEAGVVQRFGAFVRLTPPGLNYHLPWPIETVLLPAVTRINRIEIGYRSQSADEDEDAAAAARQVGQESSMLTGDENIIDIDFAVFWRIRDPAAYEFATRNPDATIKQVAESVMREVIGRTPIQPALTDARARIEADVLARAQAILETYGTGVELTQVQLQKVDPPAEVIDSFRDVQRANTEAERMVNEAQAYANNIVPRARGDAAVITAAGDAQRQAAIATATGDAHRFASVLDAYRQARAITLSRLYIETMQQVLHQTPTVVMDDKLKTVPLLPLDAGRASPGADPARLPGTKGATP